MKLCADPETIPGPQGLVQALKPELNKIFKPAFLGRMMIVPYFPVRDEALKRIVVLKLDKIKRRLQENHAVALHYDGTLVTEVAKRCTEVESGARNVDNILSNTLLPEISRELLGRMAEGLDWNWRFIPELFEVDDAQQAVIDAGIAPDPRAFEAEYRAAIAAVLSEAQVETPAEQRPILGGRRGHHSEHLGHLLAVMQFLPRTYPDATW